MTDHIQCKMNEIPIPSSLHTCCELGIEKAKQEQKGKIIMLKFHKTAIAAAAALVLAVGIFAGSNTALAKDIRGYFADVFRFDGAVVGTEYNNATDEITVTAISDGESITVTPQLLYPQEAPYAFITEISLRNVTITDSSGKKLMTVDETDPSILSNGTVSLVIPLGTVNLSPHAEYTVSFNTVVGHAKAEQPLPMSGNWSCTFMLN